MPHLIWDKDLDEIQNLIDEIRTRAKPLPLAVEKRLASIEQLLKSVRGESEPDEEPGQLIEETSNIASPTDSSAPAPRPSGDRSIDRLEKVGEAVGSAFKGRSMSMVVSLSVVLGAFLLCAVGYLTWFDMTNWSRDVMAIFFGSRTGEAISLGIGMRVIYYFVIGLALLLFGLIMFISRRASFPRAVNLLVDRSL